ncbi:MAG: hypothetical protein KIPDCIKN_00454 [Haliscomenobacter sp.]|nr:hypothetical protein [Haliscomenobacter sp.]
MCAFRLKNSIMNASLATATENKKDKPIAAIQPKLMVNAPGDRYEQEADAMADRVMRMPKQDVWNKPKATGVIAHSIQRKCSKCEVEEKKKKNGTLMRKRKGAGGFAASPGLVSRLNSTKGGGSPLPSRTRSFMENAFSTDFSGVRVHTSRQAAEMSQILQAKAFTHGKDIYFNRGQYRPEGSQGRRLLSHELTHVVQQSEGSGSGETNDCIGIQRDIWDLVSPGPSLLFKNPQILGRIFSKSPLGPYVPFKDLPGRLDIEDLFSFPYIKDIMDSEIYKFVLIVSHAEQLPEWLLSPKPFRKMNLLRSRRLLKIEESEARRVFGNSIDYSKVRIEANSLMTWGGYARTPFDTIYLPPDIYWKLTLESIQNKIPEDMDLLIHELTHVWQTQHGISTVEKIRQAIKGNYDYGGSSNLEAKRLVGKTITDFNAEQQGDIAEDYYKLIAGTKNFQSIQDFVSFFKKLSIYAPYIFDLKN